MTAFNLQLQFTGLCTFIPNADYMTSTPTKLMAVLPNADFLIQQGVPPPVALDGRPLARHRGFLRIPLANLCTPQAPTDSIGIIYITPGTRIWVETDPPEAANTKLAIQHNSSGTDGFEGVASMREMMPQPNSVDPVVVSAAPPPGVLAQVLVQGGFASVTNLPDQLWKFKTTGSDPQPPTAPAANQPPRKLAHEVTVQYYGLTKATLVMQNGGMVQHIALRPDGNNQVTVRIANLCDVNQLEWSRTPDSSPDVDFAWFYELLPEDSKAALKSSLTAAGLTVPIPDDAGAGGVDCSPLQYAALDY